VQFGSNHVKYTYDAAGVKLRKEVKNGSNLTYTDYVGGFQYTKTGTGTWVLDFVQTAEGRVMGDGTYVYDLKDHLGNVRASIDQSGVRQSDDYYPFGMTFGMAMNQTAGANKYLYNGKELQNELGLDWYDYGARMYDAAVGRWFAPDPLEQFHSPYNYAANNPVNVIDPSGMWAETATGWTTNDPNEITAFLNSIKGNEKGNGKEKEKKKKEKPEKALKDPYIIPLFPLVKEGVKQAGKSFLTAAGAAVLTGVLVFIPTSTGENDVFNSNLSPEDQQRYNELVAKANKGERLTPIEDAELQELEDILFGETLAKQLRNFQKMSQGDNTKKNEQVRSLYNEFGITNKDDQRVIHDIITGKNLSRDQIKNIIREYLNSKYKK
jgi:RHS repeat-associated protein